MKYDFLITRFPQWLPYLATLYYIDFFFILPRAVFIMGKPAAAFCVILFTVLWTIHSIALYHKKETNRKIHLAVVNIDFALRLPFVVNFIFFNKNQILWYETLFFILNIITLATALFTIYLLTDKRVKANYF